MSTESKQSDAVDIASLWLAVFGGSSESKCRTSVFGQAKVAFSSVSVEQLAATNAEAAAFLAALESARRMKVVDSKLLKKGYVVNGASSDPLNSDHLIYMVTFPKNASRLLMCRSAQGSWSFAGQMVNLPEPEAPVHTPIPTEKTYRTIRSCEEEVLNV